MRRKAKLKLSCWPPLGEALGELFWNIFLANNSMDARGVLCEEKQNSNSPVVPLWERLWESCFGSFVWRIIRWILEVFCAKKSKFKLSYWPPLGEALGELLWMGHESVEVGEGKGGGAGA